MLMVVIGFKYTKMTHLKFYMLRWILLHANSLKYLYELQIVLLMLLSKTCKITLLLMCNTSPIFAIIHILISSNCYLCLIFVAFCTDCVIKIIKVKHMCDILKFKSSFLKMAKFYKIYP